MMYATCFGVQRGREETKGAFNYNIGLPWCTGEPQCNKAPSAWSEFKGHPISEPSTCQQRQFHIEATLKKPANHLAQQLQALIRRLQQDATADGRQGLASGAGWEYKAFNNCKEQLKRKAQRGSTSHIFVSQKVNLTELLMVPCSSALLPWIQFLYQICLSFKNIFFLHSSQYTRSSERACELQLSQLLL